MIKNKIEILLLELYFFFSITFNTVYVSSDLARINPARLIFILLVIVFIYSVTKKRKLRFSKDRNNFNLIFSFIWVIYAIFISLLVSINSVISVEYIIYLSMGLVLYTIFLNIEEDKSIIVKRCANAYILGVAVNNIIGWYEIRTHIYQYVLDQTLTAYFTRHNYALTFYGNPNNLCTVLSIGILLCVGMIYTCKSKILKIFYLLVMASSFMIQINNISESNVIGVVLGILIFAFAMNRKKKLSIRKVILYFLSSVILIFSLSYFYNIFMDYIIETFSGVSIQSASLGRRILYSKDAINNMLDTCIFGVGAGNSNYYAMGIGVYGNVHNWFTEVLVDYGFLFFIMYVMFYIYNTRRLLRLPDIFDKHEDDYPMRVALGSIMVGFLVFNISSSSIFASEFIWCIWALIMYVVEPPNNRNMEISHE